MKKTILPILALVFLSHVSSQAEKKRIVTVGAIASELVCALNACDAIVAADVTSVYPPQLRHKPKVGYITRLSAEGILSLKPTHLVAVEGAGPQAIFEHLAANGVKILNIPSGLGPQIAAERLVLVGDFIGNKERAAKLVKKLHSDYRKLAEESRNKQQVKVLFLYARGAQTLLAMGKNTTAHEIIELSGLENAFLAEGAKPVSAEAVVQAAPDVVLLPEGSLAGLGGSAGLSKIPGIAETPAGLKQRVVTLEDSLLAGFGPRTAEAVRSLRQKVRNAMQR